MNRRSTCHPFCAVGTETPGGGFPHTRYGNSEPSSDGDMPWCQCHQMYIFDCIHLGTAPSHPRSHHAPDCICACTNLQASTRHQVPQSTVRHDKILSNPRQHSTQGVPCSHTDQWYTNPPVFSQGLRVESSSP